MPRGSSGRISATRDRRVALRAKRSWPHTAGSQLQCAARTTAQRRLRWGVTASAGAGATARYGLGGARWPAAVGRQEAPPPGAYRPDVQRTGEDCTGQMPAGSPLPGLPARRAPPPNIYWCCCPLQSTLFGTGMSLFAKISGAPALRTAVACHPVARACPACPSCSPCCVCTRCRQPGHRRV